MKYPIGIDCKKEFCINRINMLNWINDSKKRPWEIPNNIEGIIKCNNPYCDKYFDYIDYEDSIEYKGKCKKEVYF